MANATLTHNGTHFVWRGGYETKDLPKQAGFRWNPTEKCWWSPDAARAQKLRTFADTSAQQALQQTESIMVASRAQDNADIAIPVPEGLSYLPYQRAGIAYAMERGNVLFGDEMGLGKTIQALGYANALDARRILIICPASLRLNWQREAQKWLCRPHTYHVCQGLDDVPAHEASVIICNYDVLARKQSCVLAALLTRHFDLLIVDEAHYLKSGSKAQRAVAVLGHTDHKTKAHTRGLVECADKLCFLTGTPILNKPLEMWPLVSTLAPGRFTNFFTYAKRYCNARQVSAGRKMVWDFTGASHLDELQDLARSTCMVRRLKKDVLPELPAKRRQVLPLPQNGCAKLIAAESALWAQHEETLARLQLEADLAHANGDKEAFEQAIATLHVAARVAFTEMSAARHALAVAKAPQVAEHVVDMLENGVEKLILFAHHKDVVQILSEALREAGYEVVIVTGDTPMVARQQAVDAFQSQPDIQVFLGNIQAAGVGLTLTAAHYVVFAELDWVPANMTQAEDRAHRIGQSESVHVQLLVLDGSLDARIAQMLVEKQAIADEALDTLPVLPTQDDVPIAPMTGTFAALRQAPAATVRPKTYPVATEAQRAAALAGCRYLTARNDDMASQRNDVGWNKMDSRIGAELASRTTLSDGQTWLATKILRKYRRTQLPASVVSVLYPESK